MDNGIHWFDLTMVVILILSGIWSLFRGFLREMLALLGFVVTVTLAVSAYPYLFAALEGVVSDNWVRQVGGLALIFIAAAALFVGFVRLGIMLSHAMGLSIFDRLLGFCYGLMKAVVFVSLLFLLGNKSLPDLTLLLTHTSVMGPVFGYTADLLERLIMEQSLGVFEEPVIPEQLPVLPEPGLPEGAEPSVPDPFAPDDSVPDNGASVPELQ